MVKFQGSIIIFTKKYHHFCIFSVFPKISHYFLSINIKNLDLNKIKIDEKTYKNILIYHIRYVTVRDLSYVKTNSIHTICLITDKINGYIKESNGNKYLSLVPTNDSKEILKKYEELWSKSEIKLQK